MIELPLAKQPGTGGEKMHVDEEDGQPARTRYRVIERAGNRAAWVELQPLTGRTHQLRVHMAAIGHPIVGDGKYGGPEAFLTGSISRKMHLHARRIRIDHPDGGKIDVTAELPEHFAESLDAARLRPGARRRPAARRAEPADRASRRRRRAKAHAKSVRKERRGERRGRGKRAGEAATAQRSTPTEVTSRAAPCSTATARSSTARRNICGRWRTRFARRRPAAAADRARDPPHRRPQPRRRRSRRCCPTPTPRPARRLAAGLQARLPARCAPTARSTPSRCSTASPRRSTRSTRPAGCSASPPASPIAGLRMCLAHHGLARPLRHAADRRPPPLQAASVDARRGDGRGRAPRPRRPR